MDKYHTRKEIKENEENQTVNKYVYADCLQSSTSIINDVDNIIIFKGDKNLLINGQC